MDSDKYNRYDVNSSKKNALPIGLHQSLVDATKTPPPIPHCYDTIVLGLGAMGSACIYHLAKRGNKVLGIEQFDLANELGSSGGISRQTKVAPYLGSDHEPIIHKANENWKILEKDSGQKIYYRCGWLDIESRSELSSEFLNKSGSQIQLLSPKEVAKRYPQFENLPEERDSLFDPEGGSLLSELAIACHCRVALEKGAHLRSKESVAGWSSDSSGVTVKTCKGIYRAKHLIVSAGPWTENVLPQLKPRLNVTRLALGWFSIVGTDTFSVKSSPVWGYGDYYGFPVIADSPGVKVAKHWRGTPTKPDSLDRTPNADDQELLRRFLRENFPSVNNTLLATKICMYTHGGPWIDFVPGEKRVSFISACNGGGFKFSSAYGQALADMAMFGMTDLPVQFMNVN
jgi:sarcosine oxidase